MKFSDLLLYAKRSIFLIFIFLCCGTLAYNWTQGYWLAPAYQLETPVNLTTLNNPLGSKIW